MANITRYHPFDDMVSLREAMDRLFADSFISPRAVRNFFDRGPALANLYERDESYDIQMLLPGAKAEDVTVVAQRNTVTMKWQTSMQSSQNARQVWSGMQHGQFQESLTLPSDINADAAEATFSDEMLSLHLPKAESAKAQSLQIKSGQEQQQSEVSQSS